MVTQCRPWRSDTASRRQHTHGRRTPDSGPGQAGRGLANLESEIRDETLALRLGRQTAIQLLNEQSDGCARDLSASRLHRSEEHTSELQSPIDLVSRVL